MGRESVITQEEVNVVADQLRATGAKPTARAVREALGGGSMATVLKHTCRFGKDGRSGHPKRKQCFQSGCNALWWISSRRRSLRQR